MRGIRIAFHDCSVKKDFAVVKMECRYLDGKKCILGNAINCDLYDSIEYKSVKVLIKELWHKIFRRK
jgi:hypothetical protein